MQQSISIIIPAYNEGASVRSTLEKLLTFLTEQSFESEVIVVDDGSKDSTMQVLKSFEDRILVVKHPYNKGYGASIMTGISNAKHEWVLTYDSDGQHKPESILDLMKQMNEYDLIVGSRVSGYKGPLWRQPGKRLLHFVAEYLVQHKIPDVNSGMRLAKKTLMMKYFHIFPQGFSLSTTSTLAFLKDNYNVAFEPIAIEPRQGGKSTVRVHDGFLTMMLIVRIVMIFSPLRVFLPVAVVLSIFGVGVLVYDFMNGNIGDTAVLLIITGFILFFFGLIADQIAAIRRQIK